jgi:hypothetical protein
MSDLASDREQELDRRIRQLQLSDPSLSYGAALVEAERALALERLAGVDDSHLELCARRLMTERGLTYGAALSEADRVLREERGIITPGHGPELEAGDDDA